MTKRETLLIAITNSTSFYLSSYARHRFRVENSNPRNMQISKDSIQGSLSSNGKRYAILLAIVFLALVLYCFEAFGKEDVYALTPFCDADGTCHEKSDKPSSRTIYSAKSEEQYNLWWKFHAKLNRTAQLYAERREREVDMGMEPTRALILLGDSITEDWMGTSLDIPADRARGVPQVLSKLLADPPTSYLDPLILAIGGDQTQHLLYRLEHGQLLPAYSDDPMAIFVVLIGTNNMGAGELPGPTSKGVLAVADYILSNTKGHLLLLQNLPRGDAHRLSRICPPRCDSAGEPFRSFLPAIKKLNLAVQSGISNLAQRHGSRRLGLLDCGSPFYSNSGGEVVESLMPDLLHPNAAGHKILGECFMNYIRGLEKG
jgi:lysophospholipase L1-like esterase